MLCGPHKPDEFFDFIPQLFDLLVGGQVSPKVAFLAHGFLSFLRAFPFFTRDLGVPPHTAGATGHFLLGHHYCQINFLMMYAVTTTKPTPAKNRVPNIASAFRSSLVSFRIICPLFSYPRPSFHPLYQQRQRIKGWLVST